MSEDKPSIGGEELLAVGKVLRPHGIRGALVVEPMTDWPERFSKGAKLLLERTPGRLEEVTVASGATHKGRILLALEGVCDRNGSEALRGCHLFIHPRDAFPLGEGEYWVHELVGLEVEDPRGEELGLVADVLCRRAQDLLTVRREDGTEFGIPFVERFVKEVDVERGVVKVELPEGMGP